MLNYDDPEVLAQWSAEQRIEIAKYLKGERVLHGEVGEVPAWHLAPHLSIWAIENFKRPGSVGWWVVAGDFSNDYVPANEIKHPREAMRAIAVRWQEACEYMFRGERPPSFAIGARESDRELAPTLALRAETLLELAAEPELWRDDNN